jgi:hypothetical protein
VLVEAAVRQNLGAAVLSQMSEAQIAAACMVVRLQCGNHVRALISKHGMALEDKLLKSMLGDDLEELHQSQRMDGKVSSMLYSANKEFKDGHEYYVKGAAKLFIAWMTKHYPDIPKSLSLTRARQRWAPSRTKAFARHGSSS